MSGRLQAGQGTRALWLSAAARNPFVSEKEPERLAIFEGNVTELLPLTPPSTAAQNPRKGDIGVGLRF
jgi:hypothetical protein